MLLNVALLNFDNYVGKLLFTKVEKRFGANVKYTRFADDIVITCDKPGVAKTCIPLVKSVAGVFGMQIKDKKTRIMHPGSGIFVTGINIVNSISHISISRRNRDKIKAAIYQCSKARDNDPATHRELRAKVLGRISHVMSLDKVHGSKLLDYAHKHGLVSDDFTIHNVKASTAHMIVNKVREDRKRVFSTKVSQKIEDENHDASNCNESSRPF